MYTIPIPYVPRDERIGSVFNEMFQIVNETEAHREDVVNWDFKYCMFLHPFFVAALAIYRDNFDGCIHLQNISPVLDNYFKYINFDGLFDVEDEEKMYARLQQYVVRSYTPICKFELSRVNVDKIQTVFQRVVESQVKIDRGITTPLSYMLGELIDNINEHAKSKYGYLFSQYVRSENCINICIADAGVTVFGSYVQNGKYLDKIEGSEAKAQQLANTGFSTKNRPESESRGFGIPTTKNILVNGLSGAFFMLSGQAYHRYDKDSPAVYIEIPDPLVWNGTIILLKIPVIPPKDFNYLDYLD